MADSQQAGGPKTVNDYFKYYHWLFGRHGGGCNEKHCLLPEATVNQRF
jgi:hypothetical protein